MRPKQRLAGALAALCVLAAPLAARADAPEVEASVDRLRVERGGELSLRIRLRGDAAGQQPELSGLEAAFHVQGVQQTQRMSIVNGAMDRSVDWVVGLVPRREGSLVIPALPVGSDATEPIEIEVVASAADPGGAAQDDAEVAAEPVRVELEADREDPYEHERVLVRVRLLAADEILDGALGEPEVPGAAVEQLGGDRAIEREIAGRTWHGIERSYAIVPDARGEIALPPIRFEGHVAAPSPPPGSRRHGSAGGSLFQDLLWRSGIREDFFDGFLGSRSLRVAARSQPVVLRVRPRPPGAEGQWWLPARSLEVQESFEPQVAELRVGEPLVRRIEIRAEGVSPPQLPPLELPEVAGAKQYAEAPHTAQDSRGSVRVQETTLIPTQPGALTLPPLEIAWWDVQADAPRTATLPARELRVLPAAGDAAPPVAPPAPVAQAAAPTGPRAEAPAAPVESFAARRAPLVGALAALLAAALGLGVRAAWRAWRPAGAGRDALRRAERALRLACLAADAAGADAALRALGVALDPQASGLDAATARRLGGDELAREVAALRATRYSRADDLAWDGGALWRAWRRARRRHRPRAARPALPPLYPVPPGGAAHRAG